MIMKHEVKFTLKYKIKGGKSSTITGTRCFKTELALRNFVNDLDRPHELLYADEICRLAVF